MSRCSILFTLVLTGFRSIKFSRRTSFFFFSLKLHQLFHIPVHERKRKKGEETESLLLFLEVCRRGWFHDSKCSCVRGRKSVGLEHVISLLHVAQFSRVLLCCACVKKKKKDACVFFRYREKKRISLAFKTSDNKRNLDLTSSFPLFVCALKNKIRVYVDFFFNSWRKYFLWRLVSYQWLIDVRQPFGFLSC